MEAKQINNLSEPKIRREIAQLIYHNAPLLGHNSFSGDKLCSGTVIIYCSGGKHRGKNIIVNPRTLIIGLVFVVLI